MNKWVTVVLCVALCQMAGVIGSVFTYQSIPTWYSALNKPWFTPPNWLFAPVWLSLFTLMGISLYWVLQKGVKNVKIPLAIFTSQLALNTLWNFLFFGLRNPLYGLVGIITLWLLIAATIIEFHKASKKAGLLLVPYIIWVTIATLLNYYVWILN
jgi:translocator protein